MASTGTSGSNVEFKGTFQNTSNNTVNLQLYQMKQGDPGENDLNLMELNLI